MKLNLPILAVFICLFCACNKDQLYVATDLDNQLEYAITKAAPDKTLEHFILPEDISQIPQDPQNPLTAEKIALGKQLFFETGLALAPAKDISKGTYSCGTCHIPSAGFKPGNFQGIADGGVGYGNNGEGRSKRINYEADEIDAQGVRPLSVLNVAYVTNTLWNGQFGGGGVNEGTEHLWSLEEGTEINHLGLSGLESQNIEGLDLHRMVINETVLDTLGYKAIYDDVFSDFPAEERYSKLTTSFAISAYLRSLITNEAPFQKWLKGDKAVLSDAEKRGAKLFFSEAKCYVCHSGKSLNNMEFYALGVKDLHEKGGLNTSLEDKKNLGRGGFTKEAEDMYKFKVPQLYNLNGSGFFFHGSSKNSLRDVVEYFNDAIPENVNVPESQIAPIFKPLGLSDEQMDDLVQFLDKSLKDPYLDRYAPVEVQSGNCIPNNDLLSKYDLGCE